MLTLKLLKCQNMKYLVRSLKYFLYLLIILALVIAALIVTGLVEADFETMFKNGYDSYWQIALVAAVLAALYPRMGYSTRTAHLYGEPADVKARLDHVMDLHGYRLSKDLGEEGLRYVRRSGLSRALKMWEDTLTCRITAPGVEIEGPTKDLVRIVSGLEAQID